MKSLNIMNYPEEYKGMKVRLFAMYINWFDRLVPEGSFDFGFYHISRSGAIRSHEQDMADKDEDEEAFALHKSVMERIDPDNNPKIINQHFCDSVGCFTGWACQCTFMGNPPSYYDEWTAYAFALKMGIHKDICSTLFIPHHMRITYLDSLEFFKRLGVVEADATKDQIVSRARAFLDGVMDDEIHPNPTVSMSEIDG